MINTARVEEFGRSILECLSKGKIIFTTPTTGAKEIIKKNNFVLISKNFTPESLIETVNKFEKNPKKLTINLKRYLYKENKNKLKKIVKSLLKQGNGGSEIFK